jgi:hypothetical protein
MVALVATPPDAAHQGSDPRPLVDAVHGAASLPGPVIRERQIVEVEVVVVPGPEDPLRVWFDTHYSFCPLSLEIRCTEVLSTRLPGCSAVLQFSEATGRTCSPSCELQLTGDGVQPIGAVRGRLATLRRPKVLGVTPHLFPRLW